MAHDKRPLDEKAARDVQESPAKRRKKQQPTGQTGSLFDPVGLFHYKQRMLLPRGSPAWDLWEWISALPIEEPMIVRVEGHGIWCCKFEGTVSEHEPVSVLPATREPITLLKAHKVMHEDEAGDDGQHPYLGFEVPVAEWDYQSHPMTNVFVIPGGISVGATLLGNPGSWGARKDFGHDLDFELCVNAAGPRLICHEREEADGEAKEVTFRMEIVREDQDWTEWYWEEDTLENVQTTVDAGVGHCLPKVVVGLILEHCIVPSEAAKRAYEWVVRQNERRQRRVGVLA